jgi:hypothetical protein
MPDKVVAFLLGAICGACSALAVFPIYEKVLRILKPIRERNDNFLYLLVGASWLLGFCAVFVIFPMLLLKPSGYASAYLIVFGIVGVIRGISFRRRMIAEGLDPRTENKKYRI